MQAGTNLFMSTPVIQNYAAPSVSLIEFLKNNAQPVPCDVADKIKGLHTYKMLGLEGTQDKMTLRSGVLAKLLSAVDSLGYGYQVLIFDAFRTRATQATLFHMIYDQQKKAHPSASHAELMSITRQFVAHPEEKGRFRVPPHNSGGAVDLTLALHGDVLDFGTAFDELSPLSETNAFEKEWAASSGFSEDRWLKVRQNRRLLFNALKAQGFVNYPEEWWHYDLGDCIWAETCKVDWFYPSMEM